MASWSASRDELLQMTMLDITPDFSERQLRDLLGPLARGEQTSMMFTTVHRHRDGTDDAEHARRLATVVDDLDDTIREIRSVIFSLQADARDTGGVRAEVLRIADDEREALGFEPRIHFDGPVDAIDERIARELLPALREALSNVARHAGASSVEIVVENGDQVTLRVVDNGRGMPVTLSSGHGIRNLTERAMRLGGNCRVSSRPDGGTVLDWQVPARS